jgi:hypothetical protein
MAELPNRDELEAAFARAFGKVARRHMHELRGHLGDPPSIDNVPPEFWEKIEHEAEQAVYPHLYSIFLHSANYHGWGNETDDSTKVKALGDFIRKPAKALTDAALAAFGWAKERAKQFASNWVTSRREGIGKALEKELQKQEQSEPERPEIIPFPTGEPTPQPDEPEPDEPPGISRDRLDEILDHFFGPVAIERNVVDETTQGRHQGAETAIEATVGLGEDDRWRTQKDSAVCPICAPNEGKRREDWPAKFAEGPPCHPRCRCWIEYSGFDPDHVPNVPIIPHPPEDWLDDWMSGAAQREANKPQIWKPIGKKSLKAFNPTEARDDSGKWTIGAAESAEMLDKIRAGDKRSKNQGDLRRVNKEEPHKLVKFLLSDLTEDQVQHLRESTDAKRVEKYATQQIDTPVHITRGRRGGWVVNDGGHRILAA